MQEWITTMYLMARAQVSRPERDYPYLEFGRRHLMETLVAMLSSAIGRDTSISFFPNSTKFLRWIFHFAFRWLYTLISSRVRRFSTNSMRVELDGLYGFSSSFMDSFWLKLLICEHYSSFGLKLNLSLCPLMLSWITLIPASMCAVVILKNSLPQYERDHSVDFHVENDKINGDKEILYFHHNIPGNPRRMTN